MTRAKRHHQVPRAYLNRFATEEIVRATGASRPTTTNQYTIRSAAKAAHEQAVTNGLFLNSGEQVLAALVRPTEYRFCDGSAEPIFDVSFQLRGHSEPLVVTVGKTDAASMVVCTY